MHIMKREAVIVVPNGEFEISPAIRE